MLSLAPIVVEIPMARGSGHKITSSVRYRSGETETGQLVWYAKMCCS